ncbi:hypothetical protein Tco_1562032 [Tanacetum coccineum]
MEQLPCCDQDDINQRVKPRSAMTRVRDHYHLYAELRRKLFKGTDDEDAHEHVRRVLEIAYLFHFLDVTHDAVMLRVCPHHDLNIQQRVRIFYTGLYIPTRIMLESKGNIPLMTPTQALKSIQVMADHSRNWYDEATTRERINGSSYDVDIKKLDENVHVFQVSCKTCEGMHLTEECTLRKEDKAVEHNKYMRSLEETIIKFYEDSIKKTSRK